MLSYLIGIKYLGAQKLLALHSESIRVEFLHANLFLVLR